MPCLCCIIEEDVRHEIVYEPEDIAQFASDPPHGITAYGEALDSHAIDPRRAPPSACHDHDVVSALGKPFAYPLNDTLRAPDRWGVALDGENDP